MSADGPSRAQPPGDGSPTPPPGHDGFTEGIDKRTQRITLIVLLGLVVVAAVFLVSFAFSGAAVPDPVSTSTARPTPQPTPTGTRAVADPASAPSGPVAPGTWSWNELGGGECLEPYTTPWAEEFTVVDCVQPHHGQVLARGVVDGDASAPWPGEEALTSRLGLLCSESSVIDYGRAGAFSDVQLQLTYPADEAQWAAGDRSYFCFVSRSGGEALTESLRPS